MAQIVIYAILAAATYLLSTRVDVWTGLVLVAASVIMVSASIVELIHYMVHSYTRARKEWNVGSEAGEVALMNARTAYLHQIGMLSTEQLALVGRINAKSVLIPGSLSLDPEECIMLDEEELLPRKLVRNFLKAGGELYLCPVGHFGEGSIERMVAQSVTDFMVKNNYAEKAVGNRPARWLLREAAMKAIGEVIP